MQKPLTNHAYIDGANLHNAMRDAYEKKMERAILVSSDGDYAELVKFLNNRNQFETIISPSKKEKCSLLLKRTDAPILYIADKRNALELK